MTDIDTTIEKWVASWNDPDSAARRRVIDEIWAADGVYRNARTGVHGTDRHRRRGDPGLRRVLGERFCVPGRERRHKP
jgi:hypothetical protein